jgi:hypothetical protein
MFRKDATIKKIKIKINKKPIQKKRGHLHSHEGRLCLNKATRQAN